MYDKFICFWQLSFSMIEEWVVNNPSASICTYEGVNEFKDVAIFQDYHGLPKFRNVCLIFYISPFTYTV